MVARQHPQAAGINRQTFANAVFHGKIRGQQVAVFAAVLLVPRLRIFFVLVIGFSHPVDVGYKFRVFAEFFKAFLRYAAQKPFGAAFGGRPKFGVYLYKKQNGLPVPSEPHIISQFFQKFNAFRQIGLYVKRMNFH